MRAIATALTFVLATGASSAQGRAPPLPPPRPSSLGQPPTSPSTRAPQPSTPQASAPDAADAPLDLEHPPMLPAASKKRMSECGHEWEAMKKAGKDVGIGWREFATRCLTK